jgi:DNA-binding MarR family transcriptional regulator
MTENPLPGMDAYDFILQYIDSVPHLEALMLLWNSRPVGWTSEDLATRLYIPSEKVGDLLRDLVRRRWITESHSSPARYSYFPGSEEQDEMMRQVDAAYRRDLVRISTMIHSKAPSAVREFARAFRFKKERD